MEFQTSFHVYFPIFLSWISLRYWIKITWQYLHTSFLSSFIVLAIMYECLILMTTVSKHHHLQPRELLATGLSSTYWAFFPENILDGRADAGGTPPSVLSTESSFKTRMSIPSNKLSSIIWMMIIFSLIFSVAKGFREKWKLDFRFIILNENWCTRVVLYA